MNALSYWNADRDVCVIRFERPVERIGQCPFNAVNYALETFYNQSTVVDPFCITVWDTPTTQWGIIVAEALDLSDDAAFALASSITDTGSAEPPYNTRQWAF